MKPLLTALENTGKFLSVHASPLEKNSLYGPLKLHQELEEIITSEHKENAWFTEDNIRLAIKGISFLLNPQSLRKWVNSYPELGKRSAQRQIGVIMAGNLPLVGFHDLLCVLISGHSFLGKASSRDERLIKKTAEIIAYYAPEAGERIHFTSDPFTKPDGIIATGSNNTSRYFEYYFREIPHIIRKNRNGIAVLHGSETEAELYQLGRDIFSYFGLGCRNVTKIYLPEHFDPVRLMQVFDRFITLNQHHKYANNVAYHRSIYLMNRENFLDNGIVLLKESSEIASPVGVVYYEYYSEIDSLISQLESRREEIQCIVDNEKYVPGAIEPGKTQFPELWDYADGVDTIAFLTKIAS